MKEYWNKTHKEKYSKADWVNKPSIFAEQVAKLFPPHGRLLEIGTGQGGDAEYFHSLGYEVVATDYSEEALTRAIARVKGVEFINLDTARGLPFEDESFNIVYSHLALHYFDYETTEKIFQDVYRVLKPGGIFATLTNTTADPEVTKYEYEKLELDFYQDPKGVKKRYFSIQSMKELTASLFAPVLLDDKGETYKDVEPNLIRFVGRKI